MSLASGGSPTFPLVVHQPASPSIWPEVPSLWRSLFIDPGVTMWCQKLCVLYGCVLQRVHSSDGCELLSTLCMYDLRRVIYLF